MNIRDLSPKIFLIFVIIIGAALVSFFIWHGMGGVFKMKKYDRNVWLASKSDVPNSEATTCLDRAEMAHDVVTNIIRPGMTRADVIHHLGEPAEKKKQKLMYYLGMCRLMSVDYDYIDINIDSRDRVMRAAIVNH